MRRTPKDKTNFYEQQLIGDNTDDGVDVDAREETVGKLRAKIAAGAFIIAAGTAATTYFLTKWLSPEKSSALPKCQSNATGYVNVSYGVSVPFDRNETWVEPTNAETLLYLACNALVCKVPEALKSLENVTLPVVTQVCLTYQKYFNETGDTVSQCIKLESASARDGVIEACRIGAKTSIWEEYLRLNKTSGNYTLHELRLDVNPDATPKIPSHK